MKCKSKANEQIKDGLKECLAANTHINNKDIYTKKFPINLYDTFKGVNRWHETILSKYYQ